MDILNNYNVDAFTGAILILSVLAFLTTIVTQFLKKTLLQDFTSFEFLCWIVALLFTELSVFFIKEMGVIQSYKASYFIVAFIASFIVSIVASAGWDKVKEIWDKVNYK